MNHPAPAEKMLQDRPIISLSAWPHLSLLSLPHAYHLSVCPSPLIYVMLFSLSQSFYWKQCSELSLHPNLCRHPPPSPHTVYLYYRSFDHKFYSVVFFDLLVFSFLTASLIPLVLNSSPLPSFYFGLFGCYWSISLQFLQRLPPYSVCLIHLCCPIKALQLCHKSMSSYN